MWTVQAAIPVGEDVERIAVIGKQLATVSRSHVGADGARYRIVQILNQNGTVAQQSRVPNADSVITGPVGEVWFMAHVAARSINEKGHTTLVPKILSPTHAMMSGSTLGWADGEKVILHVGGYISSVIELQRYDCAWTISKDANRLFVLPSSNQGLSLRVHRLDGKLEREVRIVDANGKPARDPGYFLDCLSVDATSLILLYRCENSQAILIGAVDIATGVVRTIGTTKLVYSPRGVPTRGLVAAFGGNQLAILEDRAVRRLTVVPR